MDEENPLIWQQLFRLLHVAVQLPQRPHPDQKIAELEGDEEDVTAKREDAERENCVGEERK